MNLDAFIREKIREYVREELAALRDQSHVITTGDRSTWPREWSSWSTRRVRDRVRPAGARRVGKGKATTWEVTRAELDAHYTTRPAQFPPHTLSVSDLDLAEQALASVDVRSTRRIA